MLPEMEWAAAIEATVGRAGTGGGIFRLAGTGGGSLGGKLVWWAMDVKQLDSLLILHNAPTAMELAL